jgi:hypothetical protein
VCVCVKERERERKERSSVCLLVRLIGDRLGGMVV